MEDTAIERARSLKFVQIVFAVLAVLSLAASLIVGLHGEALDLPEASQRTIAIAFLCVGVLDTGLLLAWERIFARLQP